MKKANLILIICIPLLIFGCTKKEIEDTISEPEQEQTIPQELPEEPAITQQPEEKPIQEKTIPKEPKPIEKPMEKQPEKKLIMFHNNRGPMCIEQLDFLDEIKSKYPALIIEEYLTYESGTTNLLYDLMPQYGKSEGISSNFQYLPITFINNHAYSGFNEEVKQKLETDIKEICK